MVIPLRALICGIPILIVGILAALPFRRDPAAVSADTVTQSTPLAKSTIEPVQEVPLTEVPDWHEPAADATNDPSPWLGEDLPPMAENYQAIEVPLHRPAKIAERYTAVAEDGPSVSPPATPPGPLVGHPAALASTATNRAAKPAQSHSSWERAIPLGSPPLPERLAGQKDAARGAAPRPADGTKDTHVLPPPSTATSVAGGNDPWPTLAELASAKANRRQQQESAREAPSPAPPSETVATADQEHRAVDLSTDARRANERSVERGRLSQSAASTASPRKRHFIREPASS